MKFFKAKGQPSPDIDKPVSAPASGSGVGRRGLVVGAGVAGAAAVTAAALHRGSVSSPAVASSGPSSAGHDGYRLTDHIKRYYETTRS